MRRVTRDLLIEEAEGIISSIDERIEGGHEMPENHIDKGELARMKDLIQCYKEALAQELEIDNLCPSATRVVIDQWPLGEALANRIIRFEEACRAS